VTSREPHRYFAVVDGDHDVDDPLTVVRVTADAGVTELTHNVAWVRTTLLDRIVAGEVPQQARPITEEAAVRIRERWDQKIAYRYFILVRDDDPTDKPVGVLRERDTSGWPGVHSETYTGHVDRWQHSNVRKDIERGSDISTRIVASDAATVHRFISSL